MHIEEVPPSERTFTVTLTESELRMLAGVLDFPVWSDQPDDVGAFCKKLHGAANDALCDFVTADTIGMVPGRVSVAGDV